VASIVEECSDTFEDPKPPWRERKQRYINHLAHASDDTILVSLADKLDNARAILRDYRQHGDELWQRFSVRDPRQPCGITDRYWPSIADAMRPTPAHQAA